MSRLGSRALFLLILLVLAAFAAQAEWRQIGPFGGDVRSLAPHPDNPSFILAGKSNGQVYASSDGGRTWRWWGEVAARHDYVVDDIVIDVVTPRIVYAGVWSTEAYGGGGVFRSADGGRTWKQLRGVAGQSVRSLVQSRRNPRVLVAGTTEGVFRTQNGGETWQRISPAGHAEIRNIESLAVDPRDPDIIYAGTFHLPWKTTDGGETWNSIRTGMIDDSDVFSIVVDYRNPETVYASACSGIYRSDNGGAQWRKIQGIPHTARRTRVIHQDPANPNIVYAGTTEGLWKTESGGAAWKRVTSPRIVVNDIVVDRTDPTRVLLATDRAGVLQSGDAGQTFVAANEGFVHRQVSSVAFDPAERRLYAAVLYDKEYGGVFASREGREWEQLNSGLEDREVVAMLYAAGARGGRVLAGLMNGLAAWDSKKGAWQPIGRIVKGPAAATASGGALPAVKAPARKTARPAAEKRARTAGPRRTARTRSKPDERPAPTAPSGGPAFTYAVRELFQSGLGEPVYAATDHGILKSDDLGDTWRLISPWIDATAVAADDNFVVAGSHNGLSLTLNGGGHWFHVFLPGAAGLPRHVNALAVRDQIVYVATDAGLYRSVDRGAKWQKKGNGVPYGPVSGVRIHPQDARLVFVTASDTGYVYYSTDSGATFQTFDRNGLVGARLRSLELMPRRDSVELFVLSGYDGVFTRDLTPSATGPVRATAGAGSAASQQ